MHYAYDNSADNVRNPHSPPIRVIYGPLTTDEMGDLNIRVETKNFEDRRVLSADVAKLQIQTVIHGLRQEIARDPKDVEALASYAGMMLASGNDRLAEPHLKMILAVEPRHVYGNSLMGALLIGKNDPMGALEYLNIATQEDPNHPEARQNLAIALIQLGKMDAAAYHMFKVAKIRPNFSCHYFLGNYFHGKQQWERAAKHLEAALSYNPGHAEARYLLGESLWQQGHQDDAVAALEETLRRKPDFAKARQLLQQIRSSGANKAERPLAPIQ
jgi:predicted Zn-dependent protease